MCIRDRFATSARFLARKQKLTMLEKALVDEHQYRSGKAALDSELKTLLAKQQEALEPNDEVRVIICLWCFWLLTAPVACMLSSCVWGWLRCWWEWCW